MIATLNQAQRSGGILTNVMALIMQDYSWVSIILKDQGGIEDLVNKGARDSTDNI